MPEAIAYQLYETPVGHALVAASALGVCALYLGQEPEALVGALESHMPDKWLVNSATPLLDNMQRALGQYFAGEYIAWNSTPLDTRGTPFQQKIWRTLQEIPAGKTVSYSTLAHMAGSPEAVRAAGSACGANPVAIVIPCHRVIHKDGSLSEYGWGTDIKEQLLELEKRTALQAA